MLIGFHVKSQQADDDDENAENKTTILLLYQADANAENSENSIWIWQEGFGNRIEWVCDTRTKKMTRLNDETVIFRDDIVKYDERRQDAQQSDQSGGEDNQEMIENKIVKNDFVIKQIKIEVDFNSYTVDDIYTQN